MGGQALNAAINYTLVATTGLTLGGLVYEAFNPTDSQDAANDPSYDDDGKQCGDDDEDIGCDEWLELLNNEYGLIEKLEKAGGYMDPQKKQHNKSVTLFCQICPSLCSQARRFY